MDFDHPGPGSPAAGVTPSTYRLAPRRPGLVALAAGPVRLASGAACGCPLATSSRRRAAPPHRGVAAYLAKIPAAISGQRGHDRTFHAACVLVKGFGLTVDEARPFLAEWNERCVPPWSAAELEHKLRSRRGRRG